MRFIHISDLHIGKKLKEASLEEDQRHILAQIIGIVSEQRPDGVLIAGDVYDTTSPTIESVTMLDWFLTELTSMDVPVFMISGNHDSPEKLSFGSRMFEKNRLYISGAYSGHLDVHTLTKDGESVDICMLPFIKPVHARRAHPEDVVESYGDAVRSAIGHTELGEGRKRILMTHQFVMSNGIAPRMSDSESVFVGGTESVDASLFDRFDYVALGHIHRPQSVGRPTVRYCGTPLKYSESECDHEKSVTMVDIGNEVAITTIPLVPLRDLRVIRGPIDRLIEEGKKDSNRDDFIYVKLDVNSIDALSRLREVYPNVMSIEVGETTGSEYIEEGEPEPWGLDMVDAFEQFYRNKTGKDLTEKQRGIVRDALPEGAVL